MIAALIVILLILWFFGYISPAGFLFPDVVLFTIAGIPITLWSLLIFIVIVWALSLLPRPLNIIAGFLLLIWLLSTFGFFLAGLPSILVIIIVLILAFSLLSQA